jgi:hypothetical protein
VATALREILGREPGSTPMCQPTPRRFPDLDVELERHNDPEPEPEPEPECEPQPEPDPSLKQPAQRRRRRRGRRGRRGGKEDWTMKLAEPCLMEVEEPDVCTPERRFDEKERRERPPRRYDKTAKVARAQPSIGLV